MKKIILASTFAVIIVLASFSSVASAQSTEPDDEPTTIFQRIRERIVDSNWEPGEILVSILVLIMILILALIGDLGPF